MNDLKYHILLGLLRAAACLPLRALYVVSDVLSFIARRIVRYRLKVVRKNLRNALPERSDGELKQIEKAFYRHLCDCIVETVKLLNISDEELLGRVEIRRSDLVDSAIADGHPVVMFLGHYGNWEWVQVVSEVFKGSDVNGEIYRPLANRTMDRIMLRIRSRFDTLCIPQRKAVRTLLRLHGDGRKFVIGFIADQYPNNENRRYWTDFLHQRAAYVTGGEEIGRRIGAQFVFLEVEKPRRGHYVMTFRPLDVPAGSVEEYPHTLMFLRMFEEQIRRSPEYWLWSHNRWRHKEPGHDVQSGEAAAAEREPLTAQADTAAEPNQE